MANFVQYCANCFTRYRQPRVFLRANQLSINSVQSAVDRHGQRCDPDCAAVWEWVNSVLCTFPSNPRMMLPVLHRVCVFALAVNNLIFLLFLSFCMSFCDLMRLACLCGSLAQCALSLKRLSAGPGFNPQTRQNKLFHDYWRACFEINFSDREEGLTVSSIICDR